METGRLLQWFRKMAFKVDKREDRKIKIHLKLLIRKKGVKAVQRARMRSLVCRGGGKVQTGW